MVAFLFSIGHAVGSDTPLKLCDFRMFWFLCNAHVSCHLPRVVLLKFSVIAKMHSAEGFEHAVL